MAFRGGARRLASLHGSFSKGGYCEAILPCSTASRAMNTAATTVETAGPRLPPEFHTGAPQLHWSLLASSRSLQGSFHTVATAAAPMHATTVVCVRKGDTVVVMGDGQVTLGSQIVKPNVRKVRRLGQGKSVIAGFAGAAADGFTLFERLESRIDEFPGQLTRACVELAKAWRTDKYLRRLDAVMVVADTKVSLMISGNGDVLEPHDGILGIGSGGTYALAAARALRDVAEFDAESIAKRAMEIAAESCIYTNSNFTMEKIVDKDFKAKDMQKEAPAEPLKSDD